MLTKEIEEAAQKYALDLDPSYQILTGEDQKAFDSFKAGAEFMQSLAEDADEKAERLAGALREVMDCYRPMSTKNPFYIAEEALKEYRGTHESR